MQTEKKTKDKVTMGLFVGAVVAVFGGVGAALFGWFGLEKPAEEISFPEVGVKKDLEGKTVSPLTGEFLAAGATVNAPAYCVQIPNGTDGARPQAGLTEAGVVFEAVAERGITRFAAIFQDPGSAVIGPIRSLRSYYLAWDTPFDCTIVHAGGSDDALEAVGSGEYDDLDENYEYMYRSNYGNRSWNNLFTTATLLAEATAGSFSNVKGFARMTPEQSADARFAATAVDPLNIVKATDGDTSATSAAVDHIEIDYSGGLSYSVVYDYDDQTNTYARSYASGLAHEVYECPGEDLGTMSPEQACTLTQVSPSVVIAMVVREKSAADGYHEDITTSGVGNAYIFQNGGVVKGSWSKASKADQIKFFDDDGEPVELAVGQTFISAVPSDDNVSY